MRMKRRIYCSRERRRRMKGKRKTRSIPSSLPPTLEIGRSRMRSSKRRSSYESACSLLFAPDEIDINRSVIFSTEDGSIVLARARVSRRTTRSPAVRRQLRRHLDRTLVSSRKFNGRKRLRRMTRQNRQSPPIQERMMRRTTSMRNEPTISKTSTISDSKKRSSIPLFSSLTV